MIRPEVASRSMSSRFLVMNADIFAELDRSPFMPRDSIGSFRADVSSAWSALRPACSMSAAVFRASAPASFRPCFSPEAMTPRRTKIDRSATFSTSVQAC